MKKLLFMLCSIALAFTLITPVSANTKKEEIGYLPLKTELSKPYYVDLQGNIITEIPSEEMYVEVIYDSRWDEAPGPSRITAYQYININGIVLKGSSGGHYANSIYNSKINVGMYIYFDTNTMKITSVKEPTVLYTYCPILTGHSAATVSAKASGGRAVATGYITYYEPYRETLSGSGSWGWV